MFATKFCLARVDKFYGNTIQLSEARLSFIIKSNQRKQDVLEMIPV